MKRLLLIISLSILAIGSFAQENITLFFLNDGSFKGFYDEEIDSITFSHLDLDSIWHSNTVVQEVWITDSVVRIPIESIDSICHKLPDPVYKPGVIRVDESYLRFIVAVDGETVTLSPSFPVEMLPKVGDVVVYEGVNELFPDGLSGKVKSVVGNSITFEDAEIPEIYDKFVFFGRYVMVKENEDDGGNENEKPQYSLRRIQGRESKEIAVMRSSGRSGSNEDYGIDNWRIGDGETDFQKNIHHTFSVEFDKVHTRLKAEITMHPVISIEYAYDAYIFNQLFFFKSTFESDYEMKFGVSLFHEAGKTDPDTILWSNNMPRWSELLINHVIDDDDEEDTQSILPIDLIFPIPDFPLLQVGFKLGAFIKTTCESELYVGFKKTGSIYKSHIFRDDNDYRDKNNYYYEAMFPGTTDFFLEGSATASLWSGLECVLNVSFGANKEIASLSEDFRMRIGPYVECNLKANISDALTDMSVYTLLKDSKVRTGYKFGTDLSLNAHYFGKKRTWNHSAGAYDILLDEQDFFIYPSFEAPEYTTSGKTLTCETKISRMTFPNHIGFALFDENGNEVARKYQDLLYYGPVEDDEFTMTVTFDNLDFANHRYTIVPTTQPFNVRAFQTDMPDALSTTVLCPDSHHPHLIDMGLPSGTKWLCHNLLANAPEEAGGYYQWGKPYRAITYTGPTYSQPNIRKSNYQGTEYDAVTTELRSDYATPTLSQFEELFENSRTDFKKNAYSKTDGIYLKGQNGANLYLPFAGYKEATKVKSDRTGHYLMSDVTYSKGNAVSNKLNLNLNGYGTTDAGYAGYSIRPVSLIVAELSFAQQMIDFDEVNVGMTVRQQIVVVNEGNVPQTIVVSDANAPFSVSPEHLGTFVLNAGEEHYIPVSFHPNSVQDYKSFVSIRYKTDDSWTVTRIPVVGKGKEESSYVTVDLGLSVMWASFNVGASSWDDYGDYYSWGETEQKSTFYWSTYKLSNGSSLTLTKYNNDPERGTVDGLTVLRSNDDVAQVNWGGDWRMPTKEEQQELRSNCTWTLTTTGSGVKGYLITSNKPGFTDRSIFLPLAGYCSGTTVRNDGDYGYYMSSSLVTSTPASAWTLTFDSEKNYELDQYRYAGYSVRPVMPCIKLTCSESVLLLEGKSQTVKIESGSGRYKCTVDDNRVVSVGISGQTLTLNALKAGRAIVYLTDSRSGQTAHIYVEVNTRPVAVDLGLPSGTKWANFNIGANRPEDYGNYYAWGEVETKDYYGWTNYEHCDGTKETCHDIGSVISGTEYDVAHVMWGDNWQMPTVDQIDELVDNCQHEITTMNGVTGTLVTGPNGNTIFLPCAGFMSSDELYYPNEYGLYKSGSRCNDDLNQSWLLNANADAFTWIGIWNSTGHSVRAVVSGLTLSVLSMDLREGQIGKTVVTSGSGGEYAIYVGNDDVVSVSIDRSTNTIYVAGIGAGTSSVVVRDPNTGAYALLNVSVNSATARAIDLGLPSGTLWANMNVGAESPEDFGGFYAWGETTEKKDYSTSDYTLNGKYTDKDGLTVLEEDDDVAHVKWGGAWHMPSKEQMRELSTECTWVWESRNGTNGFRVTGPNGNSIFLPAAGTKAAGNHNVANERLTYWSNEVNTVNTSSAWHIWSWSTPPAKESAASRVFGYSVRPVR